MIGLTTLFNSTNAEWRRLELAEMSRIGHEDGLVTEDSCDGGADTDGVEEWYSCRDE